MFMLMDAITNVLHVFVMDIIRVGSMTMWQLYGKLCVLFYLLVLWNDRVLLILLYFIASVVVSLY